MSSTPGVVEWQSGLFQLLCTNNQLLHCIIASSPVTRTPGKRKRVVLTIDKKLAILKRLSDGESATRLAEEMGVGKSTISDIKKTGPKLKEFASNMELSSSPASKKTMRLSKDSELDDTLSLWFIQKRSEGIPVRGDILKEKALQLNGDLGGDPGFRASNGWLNRFQNRHGMRFLTIQGEKMSASSNLVGPFKEKFQKFIEEEGLTPDQICNGDDTGLYWRVLPNRTLACGSEILAAGFKKGKERSSDPSWDGVSSVECTPFCFATRKIFRNIK
ncbi:Jerky protein-like-like [Holothuria leucospilota]|uniref:Jerky protein-like-like n=1 Tax=Holothuria leucospilota TaxID=206669 RepID=A0A9Q1BPN8_HOLLE|nr:Jerky protein-like-like [Holothuria leucospilota]